jgi:hypothetical protein
MGARHVNESVGIRILPSAQRAYADVEPPKIEETIRKELLLKSNEPYLSAAAQVKFTDSGDPEAVVAYLNRRNSYTADVYTLKLTEGEGYDVSEILPGISAIGEIKIVLPPITIKKKVDMVFGTPVPGIATALEAVERAEMIATAAGYNVEVLLGADASVANYQKYLSSGLKAFGNIGHGWTEGIVLDDGSLTYNWFNSLTGKELNPAVVYFNSCQVFNPPLQPAVMKAGARTYAGGITNLLIGPSEEVFKWFWGSVLLYGDKMGHAITAGEAIKYPNLGSHGIDGDKGAF